MKTITLIKVISLVLFSQIESLSETQKQKIEAVKIELRREILTVILKFFVGLALTSGIIISVSILGKSLQFHLSQLENQLLAELITFGSFALLCSLLLFLLFKNDLIKKHIESVPYQQTKSTINLELLFAKFLDGLIDGLKLHREDQNKSDKKKDQ